MIPLTATLLDTALTFLAAAGGLYILLSILMALASLAVIGIIVYVMIQNLS